MGESDGYRCLEVFTSAFEVKIRASRLRKWSKNKIYSWSENFNHESGKIH